ncbi:MAG TPA: hypothetical protein VFI31_27090 [Pirellulales bacterium]|nr:hypothetical protein [Pirellulales bacterium]
MPVDLWFTCEFVAFIIAAVITVYGIIKLDARLVVAAAVLGGVAWLLAAWMNSFDEPYAQLVLVTVRLRLTEAGTGRAVAHATVSVAGADESGEPAMYLAPASFCHSADDPAEDGLRVSLMVQQRIEGSLCEQYRRPAGCTELVDQRLEIAAQGYETWRGTLKQLFPTGLPDSTEQLRIVIQMRPR